MTHPADSDVCASNLGGWLCCQGLGLVLAHHAVSIVAVQCVPLPACPVQLTLVATKCCALVRAANVACSGCDVFVELAPPGYWQHVDMPSQLSSDFEEPVHDMHTVCSTLAESMQRLLLQAHSSLARTA
jgi:hypothetical protein